VNFSSKYIEQAVDQLSSLPGIGKRTALRLALNLLKRDPEEVKKFTQSIVNLKEHVNSVPSVITFPIKKFVLFAPIKKEILL
jgi:recombination protein RecR